MAHDSLGGYVRWSDYNLLLGLLMRVVEERNCRCGTLRSTEGKPCLRCRIENVLAEHEG